MAYLEREQCIQEWASLVACSEVKSLKKIHEIDFVALMLTNLDPPHFQANLKARMGELTFGQVFEELENYYTKVIGTNIKHIIGEDINIYSSKSISEIWELLLGIAIKGQNREKNINKILSMNHKSQEELMKVISKVITKLGDNVSPIAPEEKKEASQIYPSHNANIIMELSEENELLKDQVQDLLVELKSFKERKEATQKELEEKKKEIASVVEIFGNYSYQFQSAQFSDGIASLVKDVLIQNRSLSKELSKKEEKLTNLEEANRELKLAYSSVVIELEETKALSKEAQSDFRSNAMEVEKLRKENEEMMEGERALTSKVEELEEQKYYLKGIVQRFQNKINISEQKIDELIQQKHRKLQDNENGTKRGDSLDQDSLQGQTYLNDLNNSAHSDQARIKTVRYEIDEVNEPSLKNKLQRQVSHLQKKVNSLQQQNHSLKKINGVLEKVINEFTEESEGVLQKCTEQFDPIFKELMSMMENSSKHDGSNQEREELFEKITIKLGEFNQKEVQYQTTIQKLELERTQLINTVKQLSAGHGSPPTILKRKIDSHSVGTEKLKIQLEGECKKGYQATGNVQENKMNPPSQKISIPIPPSESERSSDDNESSINQNQPKVGNNLLDPGFKTKEITLESFVQDHEEQEFNRRRQYSFMANKRSDYRIFSQSELGFKEIPSNLRESCISGVGVKSSIIEDSREGEEEGEADAGSEIFDVTEIEEELASVKDKFIEMNRRSKEIYEAYLSKKKEDSREKLVENQKVRKTLDNFLNWDLKKVVGQKYSRDAGVFSPELIRLHHENRALKQNLAVLIKDKKRLMEGLSLSKEKVQIQERNQRLGRTLSQATSLLESSEENYARLFQYFSEVLHYDEQGSKTASLEAELLSMRSMCSKQSQLIESLEMELRVLSTSFLPLLSRSSFLASQ